MGPLTVDVLEKAIALLKHEHAVATIFEVPVKKPQDPECGQWAADTVFGSSFTVVLLDCIHRVMDGRTPPGLEWVSRDPPATTEGESKAE